MILINDENLHVPNCCGQCFMNKSCFGSFLGYHSTSKPKDCPLVEVEKVHLRKTFEYPKEYKLSKADFEQIFCSEFSEKITEILKPKVLSHIDFRRGAVSYNYNYTDRVTSEIIFFILRKGELK